MSSNFRYSVAAGLGVSVAVYLVEHGIAQTGMHGRMILLDDALLGTCAAAALYLFLHHFDVVRERQRRQQCTRVADQLNHHVRNALQVIVNRTAMEPHSASEIRDIDGAVNRIDWALREILPPVDGAPRREPAKQTVRSDDEKIPV